MIAGQAFFHSLTVSTPWAIVNLWRSELVEGSGVKNHKIMATATVEEKLTSVEIRLAKLEGTVEARERDLPSRLDRVESRLDRLDQKVDRIPWFILVSWVTLMLALIGGLYFR